MRRRCLALLVLSGWLLAWPAPPGRSQEEGETLFPGQPRERSMKAGERHAYRVDVGEEPVLIRVEQQGIDLVIEARGRRGWWGPCGRSRTATARS